MTVLEFDKIEDRRFETGIDRGVLFPLDGPGVPWNGLVSVTESKVRDIKSYYIDGIKFLDHIVPGAFSGKLSAFTYPDELEEILGIHEFVPGVRVHDQRAGMFHLSYRTKIGDAGGAMDDYKLHLLYNLTASPADSTFGTLGQNVQANVFEWTISGVQTVMWGIRPANHLSFDSRYVDPDVLALVEDSIYGTPFVDEENPGTDSEMPDLVTLLSTIEGMVP